MNTNIESYCGLDCADCDYKEKINCKGCIALKGELPWGKCDVAECVKGKGIRFCGECGEFPCDTLKRYSFDEEHGENGARIERCKEIKNYLVNKAREGIDPVSCCGHHCDYCFMGQWCGGCRSNYNCCSFATISDDTICPNVKCVKEKGIDGCYECEELLDCTKGYYGNANEYVAKATAVFISKYGKDKYGETLKKAIASGEKYPDSFDKTGNVDGAVELLEKYL